MAKINIKNKKVFGVLGLPRTGTSLLNNLLNTYENAFCVSEPHWVNILRPGSMRLDKVQFNVSNNSKLYNNLSDFLIKSDYDIGGVKETYREQEKESANYVLKSDKIDFIITIFREPVGGFSGWLKMNNSGYYVDVKNYINTYKNFYQDIKNSGKKIFFVKYEDLCEKGTKHLQEVFGDYMILDGVDEISGTNFIFGDGKANQGGKIDKARTDYSNVSEKDKKLIIDQLNELYNGL